VSPAEPRWVPRVVVESLHVDQIREHGGSFGSLNEEALEAALARPRNRWHYDEDADLEALAASYAHGIVTGHPFRDGNKRTALVTSVVFLELNGRPFHGSEENVIEVFLRLASAEMSETELADWFRENTG
jgi:death-on-curing protein